jgi:hypothetical protein
MKRLCCEGSSDFVMNELRKVTIELFAGCEAGALGYWLIWKSSMVKWLCPGGSTSKAVSTDALVARSKVFGKAACFDNISMKPKIRKRGKRKE